MTKTDSDSFLQKVHIFDSTLRDGAQGEGISFSVQDKIHIVQALDELGVAFIEAGNPGSNPKDLEFFGELKKLNLKYSKIVAFGSTRRKDISAQDDANLRSLLVAETEYVAIFGKTWDFHVTEILRAPLEENIAMIYDTMQFLAGQGRKIVYDAEHFFDGYKANPEYAMKTLKAAVDGGASILVLCDTNGGTLPDTVEELTALVKKEFGIPVGIHCHNDAGLAVANSLFAVKGGASQVQGTLLGFGERTGNANLSTIIPNLELKMHMPCLPEGKLALLTPISLRVSEIANITPEGGMPFVGSNAFAHKAGMHIDAVTKNPTAYEHITPDSVGNERTFLMSEVAGRSMIIEKIRKFDHSIKKDSPVASQIVTRVKELEHQGYQFEGAEGSFELLVRKNMGKYKPFFDLHYYKVIGEQPVDGNENTAFAQIKIEVESEMSITAGEGDGPVHALDIALRHGLERFYPAVRHIRLTDFKVRVLDSKSATAAKVRVLIESTDGEAVWSTVGVSADLIEASWLALVDSFEYKLISDMEKRLGHS
ncbi:citramalate synthase [Brucepastera parasyntrophica]|uniref:citramalate synthase n=1 Tax=Brucepastera parasyntrophica TaxID=2880008 RepID=UPI0021098085|nr:citramalate synthase [Brucepastera parasyntrophica]ULQ59656.1 citramalate synthase [Brucepastera parasyntrophica]